MMEMKGRANGKSLLLLRYDHALNHIGINNLPALPDDMKDALKKATKLEDKVRVLEDIEASLMRQGLI